MMFQINDLFVHQLEDIYYAEKQLVKALPKMADKKLTSLAEGKVNLRAAN